MSSTYEGWANFETWCVDHAIMSDPENALLAGRRSVARERSEGAAPGA
jgi:hypothetical protein